MTSHTRIMESKDEGMKIISPAITGRALPSQIGAWFNEVWYLTSSGYRGDLTRTVQTMAGNDEVSGYLVNCKSQIAGMPFSLPATLAIERTLIAYGLNQNPTKELLEQLVEAGCPEDSLTIPIKEANEEKEETNVPEQIDEHNF